MKSKFKILARSNRAPLGVNAEKWQSIDGRFRALAAEIAPVLQPLTEAERRQLLRVGSINESFIRDFFAVLRDHPETVPPMLRPAEALRDWELREELAARHWALLELAQQVKDTMAGLESDAYATALAGYQAMVRGGSPAGLEPVVTKLRSHFANRATRASRTRAAKRKQEREAAANAATGSAPMASSNAAEPPSPPIRDGTSHLSLVA